MELNGNQLKPLETLQTLKESLGESKRIVFPKRITRIGVYGVVIFHGKILLIEQESGPCAGLLDFPGGGIEFGESPEEALRREFAEEVAMTFDSLKLLDNLTTVDNVPGIGESEPYTFYRVGMIYHVIDPLVISSEMSGELKYNMYDWTKLSEDKCSPLLWQFLKELKIGEVPQ